MNDWRMKLRMKFKHISIVIDWRKMYENTLKGVRNDDDKQDVRAITTTLTRPLLTVFLTRYVIQNTNTAVTNPTLRPGVETRIKPNSIKIPTYRTSS